MRGREFPAEDNQQARQLAVITAFQAVESFLYTCLSSPALNVKVFRGNQTIGMRNALDRFEEAMKKQGVIAPDASVEYRSPLDRLAYQRDQVVHKGAYVGEPDASELVTAAERFVRGYSRHVFGHTLP